MAKLTIKGKSLNPRDLEISLDGVRIDKLVSLELTLDCREVNQCRIGFYVDDIHVDAEVLAELQVPVTSGKARTP